MLRNYQTTLKISSALVEAICKRYGIRNVSNVSTASSISSLRKAMRSNAWKRRLLPVAIKSMVFFAFEAFYHMGFTFKKIRLALNARRKIKINGKSHNLHASME